jgi:hypothetical protein
MDFSLEAPSSHSGAEPNTICEDVQEYEPVGYAAESLRKLSRADEEVT